MDSKDFTHFMETRKTASDSFVNGEPSPLEKISTTNDPATLFGPKGDCLEGASKVIAANNQGADHFGAGGTNNFEVMHTASSRDLAYWVGIQRSVVNVRGQPARTPIDLRVTEIFRREQGKWKLVHRHADKLAAG